MTDTPPLPEPPSRVGALTGRGIANATVLVMAGFVLSRLLGLLRENIIASVFGGGRLVDIYFTAARPPETVFYVIAGGALGSAFIPTFVGYLAKDDDENAWQMASAVTNLITLALLVICALAGIFARAVVRYALAPEFDPEAVAQTASLMRIMLISPVIFGASGLLMGMLNAHQRFVLPALAPALYNLGIIAGAILLAPTMGVAGLAWGTVLGSALHLGIQLPGLLRLKPRYAPILTLTHPGVREVLRLMAPRVLGLAIVQLNFWVELFLASGMVEGSISALRRAFFVLLLPLGIIGQSVGIAVFPTFSAHVASEDHAALQRTLGQVLRAVLFLSIPATVGLVVLRLPVIRAIYEYGEFTFTDSQAVAWALLFYGLGLVSHSLLEIVTRVFYAMHDTRTPVYVGGGAMLLNIVFSLILMRVMGDPGSLTMGPFAGLALANTLATTLEVGTLIAILRPRVGGLDGRRLLAGIIRDGIAAAAMGGMLYAALPAIDRVGVIPGLIGAMAVGGAIYWGLAWLIGSEDARMFTTMALSRIQRRTAAAE